MMRVFNYLNLESTISGNNGTLAAVRAALPAHLQNTPPPTSADGKDDSMTFHPFFSGKRISPSLGSVTDHFDAQSASALAPRLTWQNAPFILPNVIAHQRAVAEAARAPAFLGKEIPTLKNGRAYWERFGWGRFAGMVDGFPMFLRDGTGAGGYGGVTIIATPKGPFECLSDRQGQLLGVYGKGMWYPDWPSARDGQNGIAYTETSRPLITDKQGFGWLRWDGMWQGVPANEKGEHIFVMAGFEAGKDGIIKAFPPLKAGDKTKHWARHLGTSYLIENGVATDILTDKNYTIAQGVGGEAFLAPLSPGQNASILNTSGMKLLVTEDPDSGLSAAFLLNAVDYDTLARFASTPTLIEGNDARSELRFVVARGSSILSKKTFDFSNASRNPALQVDYDIATDAVTIGLKCICTATLLPDGKGFVVPERGNSPFLFAALPDGRLTYLGDNPPVKRTVVNGRSMLVHEIPQSEPSRYLKFRDGKERTIESWLPLQNGEKIFTVKDMDETLVYRQNLKDGLLETDDYSGPVKVPTEPNSANQVVFHDGRVWYPQQGPWLHSVPVDPRAELAKLRPEMWWTQENYGALEKKFTRTVGAPAYHYDDKLRIPGMKYLDWPADAIATETPARRIRETQLHTAFRSQDTEVLRHFTITSGGKSLGLPSFSVPGSWDDEDVKTVVAAYQLLADRVPVALLRNHRSEIFFPQKSLGQLLTAERTPKGIGEVMGVFDPATRVSLVERSLKEFPNPVQAIASVILHETYGHGSEDPILNGQTAELQRIAMLLDHATWEYGQNNRHEMTAVTVEGFFMHPEFYFDMPWSYTLIHRLISQMLGGRRA